MIVYSVDFGDDDHAHDGEDSECYFATLKDARKSAREHHAWLLLQWRKGEAFRKENYDDDEVAPLERPKRPPIYRNTITSQLSGRALAAALLNGSAWREKEEEIKF